MVSSYEVKEGNKKLKNVPFYGDFVLSRNQKVFLSALVFFIGYVSLYGSNPFKLDVGIANGLILVSFAGFAWAIFGE